MPNINISDSNKQVKISRTVNENKDDINNGLAKTISGTNYYKIDKYIENNAETMDLSLEEENELNKAFTSNQEKADSMNQRMFKYGFYKFSSFRDCLNGTHIKLSNYDTKWVPQGCCEVNGYTLVTAYDYTKKENSVIYVLNNAGNLINIISLDSKMHCGGISYDKATGSIYVTGNSGTNNNPNVSYVNKYNVDDVLSGASSIKATNKIQVDNNNSLKSSTKGNRSSAAYLTVANSLLYVGNFCSEAAGGIIKAYPINSDGSLGECKVLDNPNTNTQGMCVYNYKGKDYYIFSCSSGRHNNSELVVNTLNSDGKLKPIGKLDMPCMSEQISVTEKGISIIFESSAHEYSGKENKADYVVEDICYLDFEEILNKI